MLLLATSARVGVAVHSSTVPIRQPASLLCLKREGLEEAHLASLLTEVVAAVRQFAEN